MNIYLFYLFIWIYAYSEYPIVVFFNYMLSSIYFLQYTETLCIYRKLDQYTANQKLVTFCDMYYRSALIGYTLICYKLSCVNP